MLVAVVYLLMEETVFTLSTSSSFLSLYIFIYILALCSLVYSVSPLLFPPLASSSLSPSSCPRSYIRQQQIASFIPIHAVGSTVRNGLFFFAHRNAYSATGFPRQSWSSSSSVIEFIERLLHIL